jgi:preprotein translocase subunit SecG
VRRHRVIGKFMSLFIVIIHVTVCIALIMIVLLQTGKGADMGAAFGGGASQTLFGTTGASTFLTKMTTGAAVVFMLTSLTLAYMRSDRGQPALLTTDPPVSEQRAAEPAPAGEADQTAPPAADTPAAEQSPDAPQNPSPPETQGGTQPEAPKETPQ